MNDTLIKSNRNSLIELYRFLFAMWVVYYHGYFFLPKTSLFSHGYLAVDFFFILTGLFLFKSLELVKDMPFFKGFWSITWKKLKPLGITLIISLIFAQIYFWANVPNDIGDPFGFMWYIEWMVVCPGIYLALYKIIKDKNIFLIWVAVISIISYILYQTVCDHWGILRGFYGMGIGMIISTIPKNAWKIKNFNVNIIFTFIIIISTFVLAMYNGQIQNADHIFLILLFPALLYFTSCINCHFAPFNILGGLSFGMYAYQTLNRLLEFYGVYNDKQDNLQLFAILMSLTIVDYIVRLIIRNHRKKQNLPQDIKVN